MKRISLAIAAVLCAACLLSAGAGAAPPVKGGFYDGQGLTLQVNVAGTKVVRTYLNFRTRCNGRRVTGATSVPNNMRIRGGRFSFRETRRYSSTGGSQRQVGRGHFIAGGKVVLNYRQTIVNPSTGQRCDTGALRFVARTSGVQRYQTGAYRGSTAQGKPVRLQVHESTGGYIDGFNTRVRLRCDRGAGLTESAVFDSMNVDPEGRFEGRRRNMRADGTIVTRLSGRLTGTRIRGTLRARGTRIVGYTGPFDDIPVRAECDSGPVRFTAHK